MSATYIHDAPCPLSGSEHPHDMRVLAAITAEDLLLSLVDDQLSYHDYRDIETWLTAIKDAAYDAGWDAAMREVEVEGPKP